MLYCKFLQDYLLLFTGLLQLVLRHLLTPTEAIRSLTENEIEDAGDAAYHFFQFLSHDLEIQHEKIKERRKCYLNIIKTLIKETSITLLYIAKYS